MDQLGDYMKELERAFEQKAVKGKPICARLDGRAFHTFTKGLRRPYDERLSETMQFTLMELVKDTNALLGYTQSDEISLVWYLPENSASQYMFDGRVQKTCSILASIATGAFRYKMFDLIKEKRNTKPLFDCRVWQVPSLYEAYQMFKWRELDAIKNSITMAAQAHFSHNRLHGVNSYEKKQWLREIGHPWEDEPEFFRKGVYVKRVHTSMQIDEKTLSKIPPKYRPADGVIRSVVKPVTFPDMNQIEDYMILFNDQFEETVELTTHGCAK